MAKGNQDAELRRRIAQPRVKHGATGVLRQIAVELEARFSADTEYFAPSDKDFMFNLMVDDLDGILARCAEHGVTPVKTFPDEANGRFAHIMDPEGRKVELWEPRVG